MPLDLLCYFVDQIITKRTRGWLTRSTYFIYLREATTSRVILLYTHFENNKHLINVNVFTIILGRIKLALSIASQNIAAILEREIKKLQNQLDSKIGSMILRRKTLVRLLMIACAKSNSFSDLFESTFNTDVVNKKQVSATDDIVYPSCELKQPFFDQYLKGRRDAFTTAAGTLIAVRVIRKDTKESLGVILNETPHMGKLISSVVEVVRVSHIVLKLVPQKNVIFDFDFSEK